MVLLDDKLSFETKIRSSRIVGCLVTIFSLLSVLTIYYCIYQDGNLFLKTNVSPASESDSNIRIFNPNLTTTPKTSFDPLKRYSLEYGKVACWQEGGVWIKELTPVEMSSLCVDRFQDSDRSPNQSDEDDFCAQLRAFGASFWQLPPRWPEHVNWCETIDACVEPTMKVNFEVGYPTTGGIWILDTSQGWDRLYPRSLGLRNALTMDERSEVIKSLGGRFCEDIQACPDLTQHFENTKFLPSVFREL